MSEWQERKLEDLGLLQRGRSRHRPRYDFHLYGGKYPFIQTGEVREARKYIRDYEQTYSDAGLAQSKLWPKNTLCITIAANIAELAILAFDACFPDSVLGFIPNEKTDLDFVYYTLTHFQRELKHIGEGSVQDNINLGTFQDVLFPIPDLEEQKAIASVLSSLDDKIDLLHRQNTTLERMAETLFRQWFVEEAQEDWEELPLDKLVNITSSKRVFYSEYVTSGVPFYRSKEIIELHNSGSTNSELFITEARFIEISDKFGAPQENDILLTSVGTLGVPYKVKKLDRFYFKDGNLTWFKDFTGMPSVIIYCWLKSNIGKEQLDSITIGSTQAALTISGLKQIIFKVPPKAIINLAEEKLTAIYNKVDGNQKQIQTLEKLRDNLLPKLMSGELRVELVA